MEKIIFENDYFKVLLVNNILRFENLKGGAVVLPVTSENKVLLIDVYRASIKQQSLELPRGFKELNEDARTAAKRELYEETKVQIDNIHTLGTVYTDSGIMNSEIELFLAKDIQIEQIVLQQEEGIKSYRLVHYDEVMKMCLTGVIKDSYTIAAIFRAMPYFTSNKG